nr:PAS domain-containing sensor histidine kinase [Agromyces seonyuensis]
MATVPFGVESLLGAIYLPITLVFIASSAVLTARRDAAQRELLGRKTGQLERALRRARRQEVLIVEVLDSVPFGVLRIDRDGHGTLMNRAYARMFGLERDAPDSARLVEVVDADRRRPLAPDEQPFARAARGEEFQALVWAYDSTGSKRALDVVARRLVGSAGEPDGALVAARDATVEVEAVRGRDDLVLSISHDLRTPMTSVLGYLELSLDDPALPERIRSNLEIAERNGNRVLDLVALVLAGSTEDLLPLAPRRVDLVELVRDAIAGLRPLAAQHQVSVRLEAPERLDIDADPERIRRVLDNLLSNAVKYNRLRGRVDLALSSEGEEAVLVVRDTGVGISVEDQPRVFDRFYRSENARNSAAHGTGLGLGIAREVVERHGGSLELASTPGVGTTVTLRLPLRREEAA